MLFASLESARARQNRLVFFFGLASGMSIWCLESAVPLVGAFSMLLILRRRLSLSNAAAGLTPVSRWVLTARPQNCMHHFSNWRYLAVQRPGGGFLSLFQLSMFRGNKLNEMS